MGSPFAMAAIPGSSPGGGGERKGASAAIDDLTHVFAQVAERQNGRLDAVEASIGAISSHLDETNGLVAALRITGGDSGSDSSPAERRRALNAFGSFVKTGDVGAMNQLMPQAAAGSTDSDPGGGYTVLPEVGSTILERQLNVNALRQLARVQPTKASEYQELVDAGGAGAEWVGERQVRPETSANQYRLLTFPTHEIYANPALTQKLLDDSSLDLANFLTTQLARDFDQKEAAAFVSGDGINKPRGFLSYDQVANANWVWGKHGYIASGVAAALSDSTHNGGDALIEVVYGLRAPYRSNASWLMNSKTAGVVRKLKTSDDLKQYLWINSMVAGQPATLLGYPVAIDENMPDIGAGEFPIAFGDFKRGYLIVDRIGMRVLRDAYTNKPYIHFYTTKRIGAGCLDFEAIKLLKIAAS